MRSSVLALCVLLSGCATYRIETPPGACVHLQMPPVPEKFHLVVDGAKIDADPAGVEFLRYFVRARQLLRPAPVTSTAPPPAP